MQDRGRGGSGSAGQGIDTVSALPGRRGIDTLATEILEGLRQPQLRPAELLEQAFRRQALALLAALDTASTGADDLEQDAAVGIRNNPTTPSSPVFRAWLTSPGPE
jgi:hypothetical protein